MLTSVSRASAQKLVGIQTVLGSNINDPPTARLRNLLQVAVGDRPVEIRALPLFAQDYLSLVWPRRTMKAKEASRSRQSLGMGLSRAYHGFIAFLAGELKACGLDGDVRPGMGHVLFY